KSRVPLEVLNKEGGLSEEEWRIMQAHPWLGVLTLFGLRGYGEIPYRGMVVAYEHHMKNDLTGYPKSIRDRTLSIYSKIVTVADGALRQPTFLADLAHRDEQGNFPRTIVKVTDPAKYGINVSDHFV